MTGKNIVLDAIRNKTTSRPAWVPFVGVHGGHLFGVSARDYLQSSELIVKGLTRACELYRPDGLPLVFDLQMEAEVLGCALHWDDQTPPSVTSHPLTTGTLADLPAFELSKGRYPLTFEALDRIKERFGDEMALYGLITGPFTLAMHLMGTDMFLDMFQDPERVKKVIAFCAEVGCRAAEAYIERGADVVALVDPMTSQISPDHFAEFVAEPCNTVFDHIRAKGGVSSLFVCGNATRNLEAMCQTSCDNLSVDENVSLEQLKSLAGQYGKSFGGNLKLTTVLLLGSPDDARLDAIRCMDIGGEQGFILAPGCDLPFNTPAGNLEAVAEMVHDAYRREIARTTIKVREDDFEDVTLPDYDNHTQVIVDVVTLDSASCAPCQYMVAAVMDAAKRFPEKVKVREHKITTRTGLGHMAKLGVGQIPTICIDGEVKFPSLIPDVATLVKAIEEKIREKDG